MLWLLIAAVLCLIDLGIKNYIEGNKTEASNDRILKDKVTITKFYNEGAMLGLLKTKTKQLTAITLICFGAIFGLLLSLIGKKGNILMKAGVSMLLGGAASNAYERYSKGKVTDYIKFNFGCKKFRNIVFNIGDFFIFIGALLTLIGELRRK